MEIKVIQSEITKISGDALVLPVFENEAVNKDGMQAIDRTLDGLLSRLMKNGEIKGKFKELTTIYTMGKLEIPKIMVLGMGKINELDAEKVRVALAEAARFLRRKNVTIIQAWMQDCIQSVESTIAAEWLGQAVCEGVILGTYTFRRHLTKTPEHPEIKEFNLILDNPSAGVLEALKEGIRRGLITADAAVTARDLANEPANYLNPGDLAKAALKVAEKNGIQIQIMEREEMQSLGMGGILGVSQGSVQAPKFMVLSYKGKSQDQIDLALIGKGITFDSGGISLKPADNMGEMKGDMAGGADVIAAIGAIAQLKPAINVTAIVAATENMPGGSALKPGDVITIMNGKTVEIISTDAEGRLTLADAICYARKLGAQKIVDIATLTGSCHIALGDVCSGVFSNDQEFAGQIIEAGREAGECMWLMPMNDEFRELNRSDVADLKNSGGRYGGASAAAWFLREFSENIPWIHLDIAGTSTIDKERGYLIKGNTAVPVRTLINLVLKLASGK